MQNILRAWTHLLNRQHREPTGLLGRIIAERMRRQHAPETDWAFALMQLQPQDTVLEIGFGAGHGVVRALQQASHGHVVGVDRSTTLRRTVAGQLRMPILQGRLSVIQADLAALPLRGSRYDAILTIHTMYFWPDPAATLQALGDLLVPGGRCVSVFATKRRLPSGNDDIWPLQAQAETLVARFAANPGYTVRLLDGPDSRQFNNVALVLDRQPARVALPESHRLS